MKTILVIFIAFHFEAMPATQKIEFKSEKECEVALSKLNNKASEETKDKRWGNTRLVALCVKGIE